VRRASSRSEQIGIELRKGDALPRSRDVVTIYALHHIPTASVHRPRRSSAGPRGRQARAAPGRRPFHTDRGVRPPPNWSPAGIAARAPRPAAKPFEAWSITPGSGETRSRPVRAGSRGFRPRRSRGAGHQNPRGAEPNRDTLADSRSAEAATWTNRVGDAVSADRCRNVSPGASHTAPVVPRPPLRPLVVISRLEIVLQHRSAEVARRGRAFDLDRAQGVPVVPPRPLVNRTSFRPSASPHRPWSFFLSRPWSSSCPRPRAIGTKRGKPRRRPRPGSRSVVCGDGIPTASGFAGGVGGTARSPTPVKSNRQYGARCPPWEASAARRGRGVPRGIQGRRSGRRRPPGGLRPGNSRSSRGSTKTRGSGRREVWRRGPGLAREDPGTPGTAECSRRAAPRRTSRRRRIRLDALSVV